MKKALRVLILVLITLSSSAQQLSSTEQEAYIEKQKKNYLPFKPIAKEKLLNFHSFGVTITEIQDCTPFTTAYEWSPSQEKALYQMPYQKELINSSSGIPDYSIIKQEETENFKAILYTSKEYDGEDQWGIWIAIFRKSENIWQKYYTGITQNTPLHLKWKSKYPLIKNDSTVQLEAAIIQRLDEPAQPYTIGKYQLLKDSLIVAFDLTKMKLDSDGDGLTDIVENKLMLNPYEPDTNDNGIPDNIDASPKSIVDRSDKTTVYESLIAEVSNSTRENKNVNTNRMQEQWSSDSLLQIKNIGKKVQNTASTIMIISSDTAILGIKNSNRRVIVLSEKEYELYKEKNINTPEIYWFSPLFKVDNMQNTYLLSADIGPAHYDYRVEKINDKWFFYLERFLIA